MKNVKTLAIATVAVLSTISFGSFAAQSVSAHGSTLDSAEAHIAAKAQAEAQAEGASGYKITSARADNGVYMTAELYK
ncbi:MAG: YdgH/BhsA/McbA-like domain containing protein [Pantoea sp.]|uniref:YdgH/BhsA/McbA-like domain containing protein n=1 Tax=Pantoea sp. TaxID=69393 RepID=UPI00290D7604|nr:YdgH/BhsA/McbA-like domain containing protein [Pantoea sp.]MDU5779723.1 YdgH/BhsA/McbA-like domain containing protein [Pantoea sp.]